jgi:hypothetical protein
MSDFYTLLTAVGAAKFTNAVALGTAVNFTSFAVGDGNDVADPSGFISYSPDGNETALVNERYRGNVNSVVVDPQNADQLIIQCVVPTSEGGWWITELGLFDAAGDMIAIGKIAPTQKATVASGTAQDFNFKIYLKTTGSEQAVLKVDPAMVLASQQFVLDALENAGGSDIGDINGLQAALDAKSGTDHTHIIGDVGGLQTALDDKSNVGHVHASYDNAHEFTADVAANTLNVGGFEFFSLDDRVYLASSGTLPAGLSVGAYYYVVGITTSTLQLSASLGGAAIDITDVGTGTHSIHRASQHPLFLAKTIEKEDGSPVDLTGHVTAKSGINYNQQTPSISNSFNISSLVDNGIGNFTHNMTNPMASSNYYVHHTGAFQDADLNAGTLWYYGMCGPRITAAPAYSHINNIGPTDNGPPNDHLLMSVSHHGDLA